MYRLPRWLGPVDHLAFGCAGALLASETPARDDDVEISAREDRRVAGIS